MRKGLLIYNPEDYKKNKWFVSELILNASNENLDLQLILRNELILGITTEGDCCTYKVSPQGKVLLEPDFVINRTRDDLIGTHFEKMGCIVFNQSQVTRLCNHKGRTHQLVSGLDIPVVPTLLGHRDYFQVEYMPFDYPVILKSVSGHGGDEVTFHENKASLTKALTLLPCDDFVLQKPCAHPGNDIRVFVLGKEILGAVRRHSDVSFKSNYSLGGSATGYTLSLSEEAMVKKILELTDFDLVGIDFILGEDDKLLFNEIEDVVGTRTLYLNYPEINVANAYIKYIAHKLMR